MRPSFDLAETALSLTYFDPQDSNESGYGFTCLEVGSWSIHLVEIMRGYGVEDGKIGVMKHVSSTNPLCRDAFTKAALHRPEIIAPF